MQKELPKGWVETNLDFICERISNGANLIQKDAYFKDSYPITRIETIAQETIDLERVKFVAVDKDIIFRYCLSKGDILFSHINSDKHLGKTAYFDIDKHVIHGVNLLLLRCNEFYESKLLHYLFKYYRLEGKFIEVAQRAVNQSSINQKKLKEFPIPLPPLPTQHRIVSKLDTLFGHLDALKTRLDRIPQLLKAFRQSVLTQAVTGKLTEEWREGRELGEIDIEFESETDFDLHEIPESWIYSKIDLIADVKGGKRLPLGDELISEVTAHPYIRARDLKQGTVLTDNLMYISEETHKKIQRYIVKEGDVYITIVGAKIGDAGLIPVKMNGANLTENAAKITNYKNIEGEYLSIWLRSPICQDYILKSIMSAAQGKLALTRINELPVYLTVVEEQQEIVRRVESLFAKADRIEAQYQSLKTKIEQLPQALLAKAFSGELVEQLPEDGDARELLETIRQAQSPDVKKIKGETGERKPKTRRIPRGGQDDTELRQVAEPEQKYGKYKER